MMTHPVCAEWWIITINTESVLIEFLQKPPAAPHAHVSALCYFYKCAVNENETKINFKLYFCLFNFWVLIFSSHPRVSFSFISYLDPAVIDEDLQHRDVLTARVQVGQVIQGWVNGSIGPVFKLPAQVTHLIIVNFSPNDVLENLQERKISVWLNYYKLFTSKKKSSTVWI